MAPNITYEEALNTLDSMFAYPWTQEHLDTVLRHFQGHMENTIEAVLNHGSGSPESLLAQLNSNSTSGGSSAADADTSRDAEIARRLSEQLQQEDRGAARKPQKKPGMATLRSNYPAAAQPSQKYDLNSRFESQMKPSTSPMTSSSEPTKPNGKKWIGTPTDLPADFLRIPGMSSSSGVAGGSSTNPDLESDEALARMLQDSLFTEELANNPEFAHLAGGRSNGIGFGAPRIPRNRNDSHKNTNEGPNIVDKLSGMFPYFLLFLLIFLFERTDVSCCIIHFLPRNGRECEKEIGNVCTTMECK